MTSTALLLMLVACTTPMPTPAPSASPSASPSPEPSLEPPYELVINGVVDSALEDLLIQMRRLPAFAPDFQKAALTPDKKEAPGPSRTVIGVDRSVSTSGQPSAASEVLDSLLLQTARQKLTQFEVLQASPAVLKRVQYILNGTLTPLDTVVSTSRGTFRIDLSLTDAKTSHIVAQISVRFNAQGVDLKPLWCCLSH